MIKVKKSLSLLTIVFLILSNIAYAPSHPEFADDPSLYEGRPIDKSGKGSGEYYYKDGVIVYPSSSSEERDMMERFMNGQLSEEEMRMMAKAKLGDDFREEKFKRDMMEFRERAKRKDAFSYENKGFGHRYEMGPSYESYPKEHIVYGMVFEYISEEIDPREIKKYCSEPE